MAKKEVSENNKKKYPKFQKLPERLQVGIILFGEIVILLLAITSTFIINNISETMPVQKLSYNYQPSYYKIYKKAYNKFKNRTDLNPLAKERFMASYAVFYANQKFDQKLVKENEQYFDKINKLNQKFIQYAQKTQPIDWSKHIKIPNNNTSSLDTLAKQGKPVKSARVLCFDGKKAIWKEDKTFDNYLEKNTNYNGNNVNSADQLLKYFDKSQHVKIEKTVSWLNQKLLSMQQAKDNNLVISNNTDVKNLYSLNKSFYFKPLENQSTNVPSTQLPYPFTNFHNYDLNVHTVVDKLGDWPDITENYADTNEGQEDPIHDKHLDTLSTKHVYANPDEYYNAKNNKRIDEYTHVKFYIVNDPWYYNKYGYAPIEDDDPWSDIPSKSGAECINHDIKIFNKNKTNGEPLSMNKYDTLHSIVTYKTLKQAWQHNISYPTISLKASDNEISQNDNICLSPTDKMVNTNALLKRNYQNYQNFVKETIEKKSNLIPFWAYQDHSYLSNSMNVPNKKKTKKQQFKIIDTHKKTPIIDWKFKNTTNIKHSNKRSKYPKIKKYHVQLGKMENYELVHDTKPDCNYYWQKTNDRILPSWMKNLPAEKGKPLQIGTTKKDELQIKNVAIEKHEFGDYNNEHRSFIEFEIYMNWQNKSIPVMHFEDISKITTENPVYARIKNKIEFYKAGL